MASLAYVLVMNVLHRVRERRGRKHITALTGLEVRRRISDRVASEAAETMCCAALRAGNALMSVEVAMTPEGDAR